MGLGRDQNKQIQCNYRGRENACPKSCNRCACSFYEDAVKVSTGPQADIEKAIKLYKKALFLEPKHVDAWNRIGCLYYKNREYEAAINAFDKAIAIDPSFGVAILNKARSLKTLGRNVEALQIVDSLAEQYDDEDVIKLQNQLLQVTKNNTSRISLEEAIEKLTEKAYDIADENALLDEDGTVHIDSRGTEQKDLASGVYTYCKRRHGSLGIEKVWSETIITAFYAAICLQYSYDNDGKNYNPTNCFRYLCDHYDIEDVERNAERVLGIRETPEADELWDMIYSYVQFSIKILKRLESPADQDAAAIDAAESAYILGLLSIRERN